MSEQNLAPLYPLELSDSDLNAPKHSRGKAGFFADLRQRHSFMVVAGVPVGVTVGTTLFIAGVVMHGRTLYSIGAGLIMLAVMAAYFSSKKSGREENAGKENSSSHEMLSFAEDSITDDVYGDWHNSSSSNLLF